LPRTGCSIHNYGLLDFASTICTVRQPLCPSCPLRGVCAYGSQQLTSVRRSNAQKEGQPYGKPLRSPSTRT
jgi:adenine-specific DNA glycosylase